MLLLHFFFFFVKRTICRCYMPASLRYYAARVDGLAALLLPIRYYAIHHHRRHLQISS